ncbi:MAG: ABC transporter substrate-binding protein [Fibrobacterota bacterium]
MKKFFSPMIVRMLLLSLFFHACSSGPDSASSSPLLRIGYVGSDHHSALYVACASAERLKADIGMYLNEVEPRQHYELIKNGEKQADIQLVRSAGGATIPTLMSQGQFDMAFGGMGPFAFFSDRNPEIKIISPAQTEGDMLVMKTGWGASSWSEFVEKTKAQKTPLKIAFKSPVANAKLIFEQALMAEEISFSTDKSKQDVAIHFIVLQEEEHLAPSLRSGSIDGFVSNNPWCELVVHQGAGEIVTELSGLPPGTWVNHSCCGLGATATAIREKGQTMQDVLKIIIMATNYIHEDIDSAAAITSQWIGISEEVVQASMRTSGYTTHPSQEWAQQFDIWAGAMKEMGRFSNHYTELYPAQIRTAAMDLSLIEAAGRDLQESGNITQWH